MDLLHTLAADAAEPDAPPTAELTTLAREMRELKGRLDALDGERKPLQERYDILRKRELLDAMTSAGVRNLRLEDGGLFFPTTKLNASIPTEHREATLDWFEQSGLGALISRTVHPSTLASWVKETREAGGHVPPGITVFEETLIAMRKA